VLKDGLDRALPEEAIYSPPLPLEPLPSLRLGIPKLGLPELILAELEKVPSTHRVKYTEPV